MTGTRDAIAFDTALDHVATSLAVLGDTDPTQVLRAKAVGVVADPQYALDLAATADRAPTASLDRHGDGGPRRTTGRPNGRPGPVLHIHLHTAATEGSVDEVAVEPVARVHGGGATTGGPVDRGGAAVADRPRARGGGDRDGCGRP